MIVVTALVARVSGAPTWHGAPVMRIVSVVLVLAVGAALALWVGERLHVRRRQARERADR